MLQQAADRLPALEAGRLGETFVSMGISYWETGQKPNAVKLTEQGVGLMEKAAAGGGLAASALDVPYNNLATMHRQLGQDALAEQVPAEGRRPKGRHATAVARRTDSVIRPRKPAKPQGGLSHTPLRAGLSGYPARFRTLNPEP